MGVRKDYPLERYGHSHNAAPYDPSRCAFEVWRSVGNWSMPGQCTRKPTAGIFCGTHTPEAIAARAEKALAKHEATREQWRAEERREQNARRFEEALRRIAVGDLNDPVGYAQMIIRECS